jgi:hypothetical protein
VNCCSGDLPEVLEREHTMTTFVHTHYPDAHPGLIRAEAAASTWSGFKAFLSSKFTAPRSLAAFLLGAFLSALILVADQFIGAFADGHLLATWIAMWMYVFVAMALLAPAAKRSAVAILKWTRETNERAAKRRSEALYLEAARHDPRVMAELRAAILRHEETELLATGQVTPSEARKRLDELKPVALGTLGHLRYI